MRSRRRLPDGSLMYLRVPAGTTPARLSHIFSEIGLDISVDRIDVRTETYNPHAVISIPPTAVAKLLNDAMEKKAGHPLEQQFQPLIGQQKPVTQEPVTPMVPDTWPPVGVRR